MTFFWFSGLIDLVRSCGSSHLGVPLGPQRSLSKSFRMVDLWSRGTLTPRVREEKISGCCEWRARKNQPWWVRANFAEQNRASAPKSPRPTGGAPAVGRRGRECVRTLFPQKDVDPRIKWDEQSIFAPLHLSDPLPNPPLSGRGDCSKDHAVSFLSRWRGSIEEGVEARDLLSV